MLLALDLASSLNFIPFMPLSAAEKRRVRPRNFPPPPFTHHQPPTCGGSPTQFSASAAAFYTAPPLPSPRPPPPFTYIRSVEKRNIKRSFL